MQPSINESLIIMIHAPGRTSDDQRVPRIELNFAYTFGSLIETYCIVTSTVLLIDTPSLGIGAIQLCLSVSHL